MGACRFLKIVFSEKNRAGEEKRREMRKDIFKPPTATYMWLARIARARGKKPARSFVAWMFFLS